MARRGGGFSVKLAASLVAIGLCGVPWHGPGDDELRGAVIRLANHPINTTDYETGIGQRSTFALEDGSTLELDAASRVRVTFTAAQRSLELRFGRVFFTVAKDERRPFIVNAGTYAIRAVGTEFDVTFDARILAVTLVEGTLRVGSRSVDHVSPSGIEGPGILLTAGKQLVARPGSTDCSAAPKSFCAVRTVDVTRAIGWRAGRIFFEDTALADAVGEMNRYNPVQIIVGDSTLARVRINGMFRAGKQEAFVKALEQYFDVAVTHHSASVIVLRSKMTGDEVAPDLTP